MKPAHKSWKVVLIVEDDTDGRTIAELARKTHPALTIDWLPGNGIGNIKRKLASMLLLARDRFRPGQGCVAVLLDNDGKDVQRDEPHRSIARACKEQDVPLVPCVESIEAWLLADPGCAQWLGLPTKGATHTLRNPKGRVAAAFLTKTKRTYNQERARVELAKQASGPDGTRNPSLKRALDLLTSCPQRLTRAT